MRLVRGRQHSLGRGGCAGLSFASLKFSSALTHGRDHVIGTKAKTRFVVRTGDQLSELFSVRETTQGDLVVLYKRPDQVGPGYKFDDLREWRVSAHLSPNSPGFTFVSHFVFDDRQEKIYAHYLPRHGKVFAPVCAMACCDMSQERYRSQPSAKDRIVEVGSYNPALATFTFFLVISTGQASLDGFTPLNCSEYQFRHFRVSVLWAYQYLPSFHQGSILVIATAIGSSRIENLRSSTRRGISELIRTILPRLADSQFARVSRWFSREGNELPEGANQIAQLYSRNPFKVP